MIFVPRCIPRYLDVHGPHPKNVLTCYDNLISKFAVDEGNGLLVDYEFPFTEVFLKVARWT